MTARSTEAGVATARYLGALAILLSGVDHIEQYYVDHYSVVPTIGALFVLQFASSAAVALALVVPLPGRFARFASAVRTLAALGGIGIAVGALAGLLVSEYTRLFGFMESGYRAAIVLSIVLEAAAAVLLGVSAFGVLWMRRHRNTSIGAPPLHLSA